MEIKGKLLIIEQKQSGVGKSGKEWSKQCFLLETLETYPRKIYMEASSEKPIEILQKCKVGDTVNCGVNIESREYNSRWYSTISAWKIFKES